MIQSSFKCKLVKKYTNATKNGISISDDMVSNREYKISSTCGKITSESEEFQIIFSCKSEYFIADNFALYRKSSGWINRDSESNGSWSINLRQSLCDFVSSTKITQKLQILFDNSMNVDNWNDWTQIFSLKLSYHLYDSRN